MQFAYLVGGVIFFLIWVLFFSIRRDLRTEMLVMSIFAAPLGLFDFWFVPKYWKPETLFHLPVGIEGLIYSFCLGGVTAVIYQAIAKRTPRRLHGLHKSGSIIVLVITGLVFLTLESANVQNPMIALYVGLLVGIAVMLYTRRDLIHGALIGGLLFGALYFALIRSWVSLFPDVHSWFILQGLPKVFILGVPAWELLFGIIFAAYWGNMYEYIFGYKLVTKPVQHRTAKH